MKERAKEYLEKKYPRYDFKEDELNDLSNDMTDFAKQEVEKAFEIYEKQQTK